MSNIQKDRFEKNFTVTPSCWVWNLSTRKGYGRFRSNGKKVTASRFSYELYIGEIGDGMKVCHKCDNPSCVNPDHLFIGTQIENMNDMVSKNRHIDGKKRGHENGNAKLIPEQVLAIRSDQRSQSKIAIEYGVGQALVSKIKLGKLWRHL
jgi:hypothetical protein